MKVMRLQKGSVWGQILDCNLVLDSYLLGISRRVDIFIPFFIPYHTNVAEICAASHLSGARSRHLFNYLNDCQTIKKTKDHIHYEDLISSKVGARCARSTYAGGPKGK